MTVIEYIMTDDKIIKCGCKEESVREMLTFMGFGTNRTAAAIEAGVSSLSGGKQIFHVLSNILLISLCKLHWNLQVGE